MPYTDAPPGWWQDFVSALPPRTAKLAIVRADGSPHVAPVWVGHTNASLEPIDHDHDHDGDAGTDEAEAHERRGTIFVGLGARARLTSTVYLVGELSPRAGGYAPDEFEYGFGIEKRVGGHAFALTFTNTFGTTFAQLARGGTANSLYLGFNLGRKFF